jgi:hypothetical protein
MAWKTNNKEITIDTRKLIEQIISVALKKNITKRILLNFKHQIFKLRKNSFSIKLCIYKNKKKQLITLFYFEVIFFDCKKICNQKLESSKKKMHYFSLKTEIRSSQSIINILSTFFRKYYGRNQCSFNSQTQSHRPRSLQPIK